MGHNSVVSGHLKSIRIPWVGGLSKGPPDLGRHGERLALGRFRSYLSDSM